MSRFDPYDPTPPVQGLNIISSIFSYFTETKTELTLSDLFLQLSKLTKNTLTLRQTNNNIAGYLYKDGSMDFMTKSDGLINDE